MRDEAASEFHDAYRMGGLAVVGDHAFADPQIPPATDPADGKVPVRRMAAALRLDLCAAAESLAGLRIVQDRAGGVDLMLGVCVPALGCSPMVLDPCPSLSVTVHFTLLALARTAAGRWLERQHPMSSCPKPAGMQSRVPMSTPQILRTDSAELAVL
jgi:hypothetical protein